MAVVFRFTAGEVAVEVEGAEEFVRAHVQFLAPFLRRATGLPAAPPGSGVNGAPATAPAGLDGVGSWWMATVPPGSDPTLQDSILLFAYYMRTYRKTVFMSEDIRRCFQVMGIEEPRSLLQILGTLKRDHGLLLNAGRRGEYMMNTTGIARAREIVGEKRGPAPSADAAGSAPHSDSRNIFKD